MASSTLITTIIVIAIFLSCCEGCLTQRSEMFREFFQTAHGTVQGTKWAILVAGSNEYWNYRHQADICHAYQIMKRSGLKDENIIVFMYDDIAYNKENPRPGVIINNPRAKNVYPGVPKDYTGKTVNSKNLFAVLLGNKTAVEGGSGKVLKSGPKDHVFIYYADHGGAGILGMPNDEDMIYAKDLIDVLKKKRDSKTYEKMVIYVEACESGSMFDGLLPKNMSIYVTTAANPEESSFGTYCGDDVHTPKEYNGTCLGDVYSVSWMEDSDNHDPTKETLDEQYITVKKRTASAQGESSHVMQYGDLGLSKDFLALYWVGNSSKGRHTYIASQSQPLIAVDQREADLVYFKHKVWSAIEGSNERVEAQKRLDEEVSYRKHVDQSMEAIVITLFGEEKGPSMLKSVRPMGEALVDDWDCLKTMVRTYETYCGSLKTYGKKYMRAFASLCNFGVKKDQMGQASAQVCVPNHPN